MKFLHITVSLGLVGHVLSFTPSPMQQNLTDSFLAPLRKVSSGNAIENTYLVYFHKNYTLRQHFQYIGTNLSESRGFKDIAWASAYKAEFDLETLNSKVRRDPGVRLVAENDHPTFYRAVDQGEPYTPSWRQDNSTKATKREYFSDAIANAPYNLQMVGAAKRLKTPVETGAGGYEVMYGAGSGVDVYVLDSGIRISHEEFGGRASYFNGARPGDKSPYCDETEVDIEGHGTHVAGIIGSSHHGVAPHVNLISVKVAGLGNSSDYVADAIKDVIVAHNKRASLISPTNFRFRGSVINMSVGTETGPGEVVHQAIKDALNAGITVIAAAGNDYKSADKIYPCAFDEVLCVGAIDEFYNKCAFSNWGDRVDYHAPGWKVPSLSNRNDKDVVVRTGTSMATPHAAGAAAIFTSWLGLANSQAQSYIYSNSIYAGLSGFPVWWGLDRPTPDFLMINTGIQAPRKYWREPFRWAKDFPVSSRQSNKWYTEIDWRDQWTKTLSRSAQTAAMDVTLYAEMSPTPDTPLPTDIVTMTDNQIDDGFLEVTVSAPSYSSMSYSYAPITTPPYTPTSFTYAPLSSS